MGAKVEMVSTSISVSWGWHLTPNIYVGGEMQRQEGQGGRETNDRITVCCVVSNFLFQCQDKWRGGFKIDLKNQQVRWKFNVCVSVYFYMLDQMFRPKFKVAPKV